jgi:hypothetical protein
MPKSSRSLSMLMLDHSLSRLDHMLGKRNWLQIPCWNAISTDPLITSKMSWCSMHEQDMHVSLAHTYHDHRPTQESDTEERLQKVPKKR